MKRSAFLFFKGLGLLFAILCGIGTAVLGWFDGADWMNIATYSIAVTGLILWGWYHFSVRWINEDLKQNIFTKFPKEENIKDDEENEENFFFKNIRENKWKTIAFLGVILIFIFVSFISDSFFSGRTLVSFLIFLLFVIFMGVISRYIKGSKSVFIGISVLIGLFIIGSLTIPGFLTTMNMKSMLVFASFLGLATIGQTFVALLGGLDLSIPFVIGSMNVGLMSLISKGVPPWLACIVILLLGALIGFVNGTLSFRLQGQALILTLGVGFSFKYVSKSFNTASISFLVLAPYVSLNTIRKDAFCSINNLPLTTTSCLFTLE